MNTQNETAAQHAEKWARLTCRLAQIHTLLESRGVKASIEHPGYLHAELQNDSTEERFIAAGYDGAGMFTVQIQDVSGRDSQESHELPDDASVRSLALMVEALATRQDIGELMSGAGFKVVGTGGGCEACSRRIAGITFLVTNGDDPSLPARLDGPCTVSAYSGDAEEFIDGATMEYRSLVEALADGGFDS